MALRMVDWMKVVVSGDNLLMVAATDGLLTERGQHFRTYWEIE